MIAEGGRIKAIGSWQPIVDYVLIAREGITDLKPTDIHFKSFRKVVGKAGDFDGVHVLLDQAAGLDPGGFTVEVGRDVGGDGGVFVDRTEGSSKMSKRIVREAVWMVWRLRWWGITRKL